MPASDDKQPGTGKSILIAEDDPFISRMYDIKLSGAGYRVTVKNNGRAAYEAIKADHPDLALVDINMPELSGLEMLAALVGDGVDLTTMPVIVLTNSSNNDDRARAEELGAQYMVKAEMTPRQVLDKIDEKLGAGKA